ncbi:MAG: transketolase C-terminal domain-containing protein [Sphingomonadaceae bacterium]
MRETVQLTGNQAAAEAARLARTEVFPAFPITPSFPVMTFLTRAIDEGKLRARFIRVESDHSALAAAVGASLAGARTFSVTNSQGLAMMHEVLHFAAGLRLPIVMAVVNRALSAPHNRFADHGDAIAQETTGWLQLFCESNQEVLDTIVQAFRIAEDARVLLPVLVNYEGYILGDTRQEVVLPADGEVDAFLPPYSRAVLDVDQPASLNPPTGPSLYTEFKFQEHAANLAALEVIEEVSAEYGRLFGRDWDGAVEGYQTEDADALIVAMGSMVAAARQAVDAMRGAGKRIGLVKVRSFRPFPFQELARLAGRARALAVLDRCAVYGVGGALYREVLMALAQAGLSKPVLGVIAGLGGREVAPADVESVGERALSVAATGEPGGQVIWLKLNSEILREEAARWI